MDKRMVALCDIMGFSDLVENTSLDQLISRHLKIFRHALAHSVMQENIDNAENLTMQELRGQSRVGIAWFSDTILLYSLDDSDIAVQNVVETAGWLVFETIIGAPRTKVRAGISYGEFYGNETEEIFVGKVIVEAYRVEQMQDWTGGALSMGARDRMWAGGFADHPWTKHYDIPTKPEPYKDLISDLALNWTTGVHERTDLPWSVEMPVPDAKTEKEKKPIVQKWKNTQQFHRQVCRLCVS